MTIIEPDAKEAIQESLSKRDLLEIIDTLGIPDVEISERYSALLDKIVEDCDKNGVPEWEDCPKLLRNFLILAKITDKSGALISNSENPSKESAEVAEEVDYPECYGLADLRDPACERCKLAKECHEKHKNSMPVCFGKSYSDGAPECELCIEKLSCKEIK